MDDLQSISMFVEALSNDPNTNQATGIPLAARNLSRDIAIGCG